MMTTEPDAPRDEDQAEAPAAQPVVPPKPPGPTITVNRNTVVGAALLLVGIGVGMVSGMVMGNVIGNHDDGPDLREQRISEQFGPGPGQDSFPRSDRGPGQAR